MKRFWSLCEQTFLRVRALFLNRGKPHPKTEKDRCKPLHLVWTSLKRLVTIVFRWWKRQCKSFSEVKKVITGLLFTIDFVCILFIRTLESGCFRRHTTVLKPSSKVIFTVSSSWLEANLNRFKPVYKCFSHWSERQNQTREPLSVRHSLLPFCQTNNSAPVALADI